MYHGHLFAVNVANRPAIIIYTSKPIIPAKIAVRSLLLFFGSATNTKSVVAGKNDMGGSNGNMTKGGSNPAPEGSAYKQPTSYPAKGRGNLPGAGKFENVPGANAGGAFSSAKKPASSEPSGVNKTSINLKP